MSRSRKDEELAWAIAVIVVCACVLAAFIGVIFA